MSRRLVDAFMRPQLRLAVNFTGLSQQLPERHDIRCVHFLAVPQADPTFRPVIVTTFS